MDDGRGNKGAGRGKAVSGAEFAGLGAQFAGTILVFAFAGVWLDKRFGTTPWLVLLFVFLAFAGGFYSIYLKTVRGSKGDSPKAGGSDRDSERKS